MYSYKVAAGIASAVGGKQFEETQRVFRNFVDWFKEQRQKRFEAICTLPKRLEPQARILAKDLNRKLQPQPQPQPQPLPPSTTPDLSKGMTVDQPVDGDPPLTAGQPMSHLGVGEVVEEAAERVVEEAVDAVVDEIVDAAGLQTGKRPNEGEDNNRVEQKRQKTAE